MVTVFVNTVSLVCGDTTRMFFKKKSYVKGRRFVSHIKISLTFAKKCQKEEYALYMHVGSSQR